MVEKISVNIKVVGLHVERIHAECSALDFFALIGYVNYVEEVTELLSLVLYELHSAP